MVAHLAFGEHHHHGAAFTVAHGMELGVQAALGAPDTSGNSPPFKRLAAVRCALRWVVSIIIRSGSPALPASSTKMRLNTPRRLQRIDRLQIVLCGPKDRSASRHRSPFLMTKMIADTISRSSTRGILCDSGKNGSLRRICTSLRKYG